MSLLLSQRDLDFLLYEWLDVEQLTARERFAEHSRETFDGALELSAVVAEKHFSGVSNTEAVILSIISLLSFFDLPARSLTTAKAAHS